MSRVILKVLHDSFIVVFMDEAFPGENSIVYGMGIITEHAIPARTSVDITRVCVPIPDTITNDL